MCCKQSNFMMGLGGILGLVVLGAVLWYLLLPDDRKGQLQSLARQAPDVPGRTME